MAKRGKALGVLLVLLLAASISGCDKIGKKEKDASEFVRGPDGLVMSFVPNYPQDKYIVSNPKKAGEGEPISILVEVRNKGAYPPQGNVAEHIYFGTGKIHLSGFDPSIIQMKDDSGNEKLSQKIGDGTGKFVLYLPAASSVNPLGGVDTAEFDGKIIADKILIDSYNPTILVTACYPYFTKSTPTVCIDPEPFDSRQEKVCTTGSQTIPNQGAPVAVTKIEQEAATGKIQFKISIKNVGKGDVIWNKDITVVDLLDRCDPNKGGKLDRKDFDRVQLEKVKIGSDDLFAQGRCTPFADGTNNIVRMFDNEGFVICTYDVPDTIQSAYTTPIDIELRYAYRSTILKPIQIKKIAGSESTAVSKQEEIEKAEITEEETPSPTPSEEVPTEPVDTTKLELYEICGNDPSDCSNSENNAKCGSGYCGYIPTTKRCGCTTT